MSDASDTFDLVVRERLPQAVQDRDVHPQCPLKLLAEAEREGWGDLVRFVELRLELLIPFLFFLTALSRGRDARKHKFANSDRDAVCLELGTISVND